MNLDGDSKSGGLVDVGSAAKMISRKRHSFSENKSLYAVEGQVQYLTDKAIIIFKPRMQFFYV